ncbi:uncharacterized protein LOC128964898 [Oppia nitens]|uniref:uncharacterized protein LOC128964898 n=1 Tax=Oppia nitens TaxID=1686743 RepID=UPI0023DB9AE9|nr:uncharacterized protein LOC128964898 [Oppia nitens]
MNVQFEKWISGKNFEITDKINKTSNNDSNDSIVISDNEVFKTSKDIRVYYSKKNIIESVICNKFDEIESQNKTNVLKWFNDIKLRNEKLSKLSDQLKQSTKVLELLDMICTKSTLKVSRNRVQNLLTTLDYSINNQISNHLSDLQLKSLNYTVIEMFESQSFILKLIHELIPCLINGIPVILIATNKTAISAAYLLDIIENVGLEPTIVQLVIIDDINVKRLDNKTKPLTAPIVVIFESADIECGIDRIITSCINDTNNSLNVFVQQSIYKKFSILMKTRLSNTVTIGQRFDPNVDTLAPITVNYEAIDFDNENKNFDIQLFKFRSNEELKSLMNHFIDIPFISFWSEKTSLALEFATLIQSSSHIYINGSLKYPFNTEISVLNKVLDKIDINSIMTEKKFIDSIIAANNAWKSLPNEEREVVIKNFLISKNTLFDNESVPEAYNHKITELKDKNGIQLKFTRFEAIGLIVFKIDDLNEKILRLILKALVSGNSVIINTSKPNQELLKFKEYLNSLNKNILHLIDVNDFSNNSVLVQNANVIGLYLKDLNKLSSKSLVKFVKSIILLMGDISFAK